MLDDILINKTATIKKCDKTLYSNQFIKVEIEESQIPWLKIFSQQPAKEFSHCNTKTKQQIWQALDIIETEMLRFFNCDKINIASFGNYLPQVHFHIMARFKNDNFFPEPMWGKQQRDNQLALPDFDIFYQNLLPQLKQI